MTCFVLFQWESISHFQFAPLKVIDFSIPRNRNWLTIAGFQCVFGFFLCVCVFRLIPSCYCHHADSSYSSTQLIFLLQVSDLSWIKRCVHRCLIFSGAPVERCCLFAVVYSLYFRIWFFAVVYSLYFRIWFCLLLFQFHLSFAFIISFNRAPIRDPVQVLSTLLVFPFP